MKSIISIINIRYLVLWLMATYICFRLYFKQIIELDFKLWETDLTLVGSVGYVILTIKLYNNLIK
jgi:hypothetical protein